MEELSATFENYIKAYQKFHDLVDAFRILQPTSNNQHALVNYLRIKNFLWTEYDYLYRGEPISAYQKQKQEENSNTIYHDATETKIKEMKKIIKAEKDQQKKRIYARMLESITTRCDGISLDIGSCQKILKVSAKEILAYKAVSSLNISNFKVSAESTTPYTLEITINDTNTIVFDPRCVGFDPEKSLDDIHSHEWYPQPVQINPQKTKKRTAHTLGKESTGRGYLLVPPFASAADDYGGAEVFEINQDILGQGLALAKQQRWTTSSGKLRQFVLMDIIKNF